MPDFKTPNPVDARRCFRVRCRSKRGERLSSEDIEFVARMFDTYPDWYTALEVNVFNATVPYGSNVRRPTTIPDPE